MFSNRYIIFVIVLICSSSLMAQYNQDFSLSSSFSTKGSTSVGGSISFNSYKSYSDDRPYTRLSIKPEISYFIVDNIDISALFGYELNKDKDWNYENSAILYGIGGRFFINTFYLGSEFILFSFGENLELHKKDLKFKIGNLFKLTECVFINIQGYYLFGIGNVYYESNSMGKNEESELNFSLGLEYIFNNFFRN